MKEIAILMAAGLGSRMRPLTETTPKPLIRIHGKAMIETVIANQHLLASAKLMLYFDLDKILTHVD